MPPRRKKRSQLLEPGTLVVKRLPIGTYVVQELGLILRRNGPYIDDMGAYYDVLTPNGVYLFEGVYLDPL